ncbi:DUF4352 domain-containing protein [Candidatus Saccharibacteria bacterium]|nr:DUF4352 domain-containing protein [Candidatus Saccharibacteria bacterium]
MAKTTSRSTPKKKQDSPLEALSDAVQSEASELKREYKHFARFRDENSLLFGVFVFGVAAIVIINTLFWVHYTRNKTTEELKASTSVVSLQASTSLQTANNFAVLAKISNVGTSKIEDPAFPLGSGKVLLTLDINLTNRTDKTQHLIPISHFYVRSPDGDNITLQPSSYLTKPLETQDLSPNQTVSGQLSFAIPEKQVKPLLYIDTMWNDATPLVVDVLH